MLIIANGFPNHYGGVAKELAASRRDPPNWFPTNDDFRATATFSGGSSGAASTFDELLEIIAKQPERSIVDLGLIGHANIHTFALSGKVVQDGMVFSEKGMITEESIKANLDKIKAVRNRFKTQGTELATMTLFACDAGSGMALLEALAGAFQVIVQGFKTEIFWCFMGVGGRVVRGRTFFDAVGMGVHPDCGSSQFTADIRQWIPNQTVNGIQIDL
jgi:hypothetical protein